MLAPPRRESVRGSVTKEGDLNASHFEYAFERLEEILGPSE